MFVAIGRAEGVRGFFVGLTPRVGRVAPACGIMISCYELFKNVFVKNS